jgi:hypothetical protein
MFFKVVEEETQYIIVEEHDDIKRNIAYFQKGHGMKEAAERSCKKLEEKFGEKNDS